MRIRQTLLSLATVAAFAAVSASATGAHAQTMNLTLTGAEEVPPVASTAGGTATVTVNPDHTLTAKVVTQGLAPTASHIHEGAKGANGPVIVPFTKTGDNSFESSPGAKLSDAQYESFKAGKLYVNVHSAAHPGGEIRAQMTP